MKRVAWKTPSVSGFESFGTVQVTGKKERDFREILIRIERIWLAGEGRLHKVRRGFRRKPRIVYAAVEHADKNGTIFVFLTEILIFQAVAANPPSNEWMIAMVNELIDSRFLKIF